MNNLTHDLSQSLATSFIDYRSESFEDFRPKLLVNNYKKGTKVLNYLTNELEKCTEFYFSIAFITNSGLNILLEALRKLEKNGIKGKILTTNYLNFNDPKALRRLLDFKNLEVKIYDAGNFHTKGYIFKKIKSEKETEIKKEYYTLIIGSSNITQEALTKNEEWNLKVTSLENGELLMDTLSEFNSIWDRANELTDEWLNNYSEKYKKIVQYKLEDYIPVTEALDIMPNAMQREALISLEELRKSKENKGLLISATGTGKTYLSAFDVLANKPKKMLFVIHREQIAKAAMKSFKRIFGSSKTMGILSGNSKAFDCDYIFTTIQTLSKDETLNKFSRDFFDYIIIDEVHKAGAESYKKVIDYFQPKFLLGMTATPERTDGSNIFQLFDYNIAYEIRLQRALEEDMLCPFHYFGVSEIEVDGQLLDEKSSFRKLTSEERVKNIIEKAEFYGNSGSRVKGLIFCSRNEEAEELSRIFNSKGYDTIALSGNSTQEEREQAINRLEQENSENKLDYIFTRDIFNEGVDIPEVNQIIMLRPTESSVIFVQQLGRGLRKSREKDFVVIIDFIGNYQKNFLIPIALSGDRTFNKDTIRKFVMEGNSVIPGCSTIMFDEIAQKRIFDSINKTNFSSMKLLKEEYKNLKIKIGRIPNMVDFYEHGSIDPQLIISNSKSHYNFLKKVEKEYSIKLDVNQQKAIEFISNELSNGKRPHELILLKELLYSKSISRNEIDDIFKEYNVIMDEKSLNSTISILSNGFLTSTDLKKYNNANFLKLEDNNIERSVFFDNCLDDDFIDIITDLLEYSFMEYYDNYSKPYLDTNLILYQKYSRKDACRLLNWHKDESSVVFGYKIKHNTCPIFVTYDKNHDIGKSINYEDEFIDRNTFSWMTKNNRTFESRDVKQIINHRDENIRIDLFVKKADADGTDFYYLGELDYIDSKETKIKNDNNKELPIVNIKFKFKNTVREDIYDYLTK